jgi:hypothetical protein
MGMPAAVAERTIRPAAERADLISLARQLLERHPHFRGRVSAVRIEQRGRTLCLSGRLPTFYLKQLVQEALRNIPGLQGICNEIAVVSAVGVSSDC